MGGRFGEGFGDGVGAFFHVGFYSLAPLAPVCGPL